MQQLEPSRSGYKPESKCEPNPSTLATWLLGGCATASVSQAFCLRDRLMHLFATANSLQGALRLSQTNRLDRRLTAFVQCDHAPSTAVSVPQAYRLEGRLQQATNCCHGRLTIRNCVLERGLYVVLGVGTEPCAALVCC